MNLFSKQKVIKEDYRQKMMRQYIEDQNKERRSKMSGGSLGGKTHVWEYVEDLQPKMSQLMTGGVKKTKKKVSSKTKKPRTKSKSKPKPKSKSKPKSKK